MVDEENTDILKKIEISEEEEWDFENLRNGLLKIRERYLRSLYIFTKGF